jgi:hypothetical protein
MLSKSGPLTYYDTKAICSSYDFRKEIKCMSIHSSQQLIALGCLADLKLVRLDYSNCSLHEIIHGNSPPSSLQTGQFSRFGSSLASSSSSMNSPSGLTNITDVLWNLCTDSNKLAVAYFNGETKVFNFNVNERTLISDWVSEKQNCPVNRLAWNPSESSLIATGLSDGNIKLYDIREGSKKKSASSFRLKGLVVSCRDVKFNQNDSNIFASALDNGRLTIWDRRSAKKPIMSHEAHKNKVLTIEWNPLSEWIIASGSADKTVKIWDTSKCDITDGHQYHHRLNDDHLLPGSGSSRPLSTSSITTEEYAEPLLLQTLHCSGEIHRLLWNPLPPSSAIPSSATSAATSSTSVHLMTISYPSTSSTFGPENNGYISIWDIQKPNIPICILKGHGSDSCSVIDWIDTKRPSDLLEYSMVNKNEDSNSKDSKEGGNEEIKTSASLKVKKNDPSSLLIRVSSKDEGDDQPLSVKKPVITKKIKETKTIAMKCIISGGKEGVLLIQNPKFGYFPYNQISPIVATISSQGDLAYSRTEFKKVFLFVLNLFFSFIRFCFFLMLFSYILCRCSTSSCFACFCLLLLFVWFFCLSFSVLLDGRNKDSFPCLPIENISNESITVKQSKFNDIC